MTKLNEKPLSQMLEEIEPHPVAKEATLVPRASYERLRQVAIVLTEALERAKCDCTVGEQMLGHNTDCFQPYVNHALAKAKDIIGGGK